MDLAVVGEEKSIVNLFRVRFSKCLWGISLAVAIFLISLVGGLNFNSYVQTKKSAYAETHAIAVALDELNRRELEAMAFPLEMIVSQINARGGLENFSRSELDEIFIRAKKEITTTSIRNFFALDKDGYLLGGSYAPFDSSPVGLTYKEDPNFEYIRTQKRYTVISAMTSSVDQQRVLILAKSIKKDGRFSGVIGVTKMWSDFEAIYHSLGLPEGIQYALYRDDGKILYRHSLGDSSLINNFGLSDQFRLESEGALDSSARIGSSERVGYYKFNSDFGGLIYVGYDASDLFRNWYGSLFLSFGAVTVFLMGILIVTYVVQNQQDTAEKVQTLRYQRDEWIKKINAPVAFLTGIEYIKEWVSQISHHFNVPYVVVGVTMSEHTDSVKCSVNWSNGQWGSDYIYKIQGTVFENMKPGGVFSYKSGAAKIFAKDSYLGMQKIESCVGMVLRGSQDLASGILLAYSEKEISQLEVLQDILAAFAPRVGAELERLMTEEVRNEVENLRRQVEERSRQSEKLDAIGALAEGVAHEFNNIIAIILASVEKLLYTRREFGADLPYLESIKNACQRARNLISQIAGFGEGSGAHQVAIKDVVTDIVDFLHQQVPKNIHLNFDADDCGDVIITADLKQIEQIFLTLCNYLGRLFFDEGGEIKISLRQEKIRDQVYVRWIIYGVGVGDGPDGGTGFDQIYGRDLSVMVVQRIVSRHRGFFEMKNEAGQGPTFAVFLPALGVPQKQEGLHSAFDLKLAPKVMLVDDEPDIASLIKELLEMEGFNVEAYTDPVQALKVFTANQERYFLVISDLSMPQMSGFTFVRKIRELNKNISIMLWSGYHKFFEEELQDLNIKVLSKPVDVQKLLVIIQSELSQQYSLGILKAPTAPEREPPELS